MSSPESRSPNGLGDEAEKVWRGATQKMRGSDEFEAVKSAVYLFGLRRELLGRNAWDEHDRLVQGGEAAARAYLTEHLGEDPEPIHVFWGHVIESLLDLEAAIKRGQVPTGGLLDLLDAESTDLESDG